MDPQPAMNMVLNQIVRLPVGISLFLLALWHRPGDAFRALGTRLTGKRVRAMNQLRRATTEMPLLYQIWLRKVEPERIATLQAMPCLLARRLIFCLTADASTSPEDVRRSISSLPDDMSEDEVILVTAAPLADAAGLLQLDPSGLWRFLRERDEQGRPAALVPLRCGDRLAAVAAAAYRSTWYRAPDAILVYGDEDEMDASGKRSNPWFKPDWNREQFLAQDFVSGACAISISHALLAMDVSCSDEQYDVAQALAYATVLANETGEIIHVPLPLCHRLQGRQASDGLTALKLLRASLPTGVNVVPARGGTRRIDWPLPATLPRVTIIVPTRDQLPLLKTCLSGLRATDYPDLEIIIVDNDSVEPTTIAFFDRITSDVISVLPHPGPFNFAAMNNRAAHLATGSLLCFVNNDIEFLDESWLRTLTRHAIRSNAGAVGAKLLYSDGTIQHAGVAVGIGGAAGHMHKFQPDIYDRGHLEAQIQREISVATAACLLVAREKFLEVGGFDEENFAVAFNDVDLCLKLRAAGWTNYYVPHVKVIHHESKSRGSDLAPTNLARYRRELAALQHRWRTEEAADPNWSVNFDYSCEQMSIRL